MNDPSLKIMNRSFGILNKRRSSLLEDERTIDLKERVKKIREYSVEHLSSLLEKAQETLENNGIEVIMAHDAEEAREAIYQLVKSEETVAKSKSNTAGEIQLTEYLKEHEVNVLETDLGDRIVQFHQSNPTHPIGPACHLDMEIIAKVVSEEFKKEIEAEPRAILDAVKSDIMGKISQCRVGITGANSVAAEDGSLLMVHNEGNISLLTLLDLHIVVVGIDKLVPTLEDAVSVVKLETIYATGKTVPAYMNVVSSPSKTADIEQIILNDMYGAKRVVVVFLDNGRTEAIQEKKECLWCIGCGACIVNCPVYTTLGPEFGYLRHLGGRGVVLSHYIHDNDICFDSGLFKCTLCGQCTVECPMEIPVNLMLEELRIKSVKEEIYPEKHGKIKNNLKKRRSPFNPDEE
ncbi:LUD domain-containing protein [Methanobacterium sp. BAmetb5]|uniref:LUD domain-containing protein n=1 Tax=Methanobacterium sp. BAmetb5 TaxID=2025351 RepID=UPI000E97E975|nr:LUD domain-containing protein [Methanobacterium sp. BAmetb5]AXV39023.1 MAG: lactate utilization protein B/C [Methanobacterium sp. BAmetb5]